MTRHHYTHARRLLAVCLNACLLFTGTCPHTCTAHATSCTGTACNGLLWPVEGTGPHDVMNTFNPPAARWLPGHRGADIRATPGTHLTAPCTGVMRFSGQVAGKDVVSLKCAAGYTLSFEPAVSSRRRGESVTRGEPLGVTGGGSDHCADECVHWGMRNDADEYSDPLKFIKTRRIVLKPW